jgi:beta-aspartyl-peptidase (threonine type)
MSGPLVLVHGGAGDVAPERRARHAQGCLEAARAGGRVLAAGGTAVEAVVAAVELLENDPVYNAGTGCALTREGKVELDVSLMDGETRDAAGLAALAPFKNPIRIARAMLYEPEVMMAGAAATRWAERHGFQQVPEESMITEYVRARLRDVLNGAARSNFAGGTVGAVARDAAGRLAAGTSTGGTMGKLPGRVGDSPVIGAGTYADELAAVSATGDGEAFLRAVFAARLADKVRYGREPAESLRRMLERVRDRFGGIGGAILITRDSGPLRYWTSDVMSHGWWSPAGEGSGIES